MDKYENLSARKKAMADIAGMLTVATIAGIVVNVIGRYGYWMEVSLALVVIVMLGLVKTMYDIRVSAHRATEDFKNMKT
jgi:hypothetical protein